MGENLVVVNAEGPETRVGLLEDGRLAEYFLERKQERGIVGNIYRGKVQRVLPGMQAAFVKLADQIEKAAFLYGGDVVGAIDDVQELFGEDFERDGDDSGQAPARNKGQTKRVAGKRGPSRANPRRIEELIKDRQEVLVQVVKDSIGKKGARVTGHISLPGRYVVFMPQVGQIGVSRRIATDAERRRLRKLVDSARPPSAGFIVRTAAEGATDDEIRDDVDFLLKLWQEIGKRQETAKAPALVYADLDLVLRCIRDRLTDDIRAVIIDSEAEYERVRRFVSAFMPRWMERIQHYRGRDAIFDHYGLEAALRQALERKVNLKSGGSLVIDQGEALTSVDVNTGSFVGKRDLEETLTKNNLEACHEVVNQLRLRNMGGIVVIDFVDMEKEQNRKKVLSAFTEALSSDHSRTNVTKMSELGLVEMTRKRTRESLSQLLTETCPSCDGRGRVKSAQTVAYEALRDVRRLGQALAGDTIVVTCAPAVARRLKTEERQYVDELEKRFHKLVDVKASANLKPEDFKVAGSGGAAVLDEDTGADAATGAGSDAVAGARAPAGGVAMARKSRRGRRGGRGRKARSGPAAGDGANDAAVVPTPTRTKEAGDGQT
jgi:ribonuclease G